jgi:hypothetical protein
MKLSELAEKTVATIEQGVADLEIESAAGLDIAERGRERHFFAGWRND